ncbi:hemerythrin domain-containing protein [Roseibium sediminicola]|uniref:Hemerythrin domain-containing protein n=1 Tax=Roseibium sediminicola TaxID=2933272 RepID=A0ABT0H1D9_9HYPH|nr:hemerythrin domain-containing protein [Roseibium sp. CAU 1639]MCK7615512.1 hemerythrin domain-containing protein [Roseibium sp. CAU 1639]
MTADLTIRTDAMPAEMRLLLAEYPRDSWDSHPGFQEKTRGWLNAHRSFRRLAGLLREDTEAYLDRNLVPDDFAGRLSRFGNILVGNLHGHHTWEDRSYFPELSAADPRFDSGLEILEQDHAALDTVLHDFSGIANRAIKLVQLDEVQAYEEAGKLHPVTEAIEQLLDRHLSDEEELAVPIILHHRLRG